MPLPRSVARFNKRWTNRFMEPLARKAGGFAVVHHVGRKSGRSYSTPINTFPHQGHHLVALTYGPRADWYRNVLACPAKLETGGEFVPITGVRPLGRSEAAGSLPLPVRAITRAIGVRDFVLLEIGPNPAAPVQPGNSGR